MPDIIDAAGSILSQAERRVEIAGQNIANASTPGYKRRIAFATLINSGNSIETAQSVVVPVIDTAPGKLTVSNNPYDFAVTGPGLFAVRDDRGVRFSRQGRFTRDEDGRLLDALGGVLQLAGGGDLKVSTTDFTVRSDGTVMQEGAARGRIAVHAASGAGGIGEILPADQIHIQQGVYEASNVSSGDEMVKLMEALRRAEAAQRLVLTHDEMLGRAITTFGDSGR